MHYVIRASLSIFTMSVLSSLMVSANVSVVSARETEQDVRSWVNSIGHLNPPPPARPDQLLKIVRPLPTGAPGFCEEIIRDNSGVFDSMTAFDPNGGVLFPGSIIEAASLESGILTARPQRRGRGSLNITGLTFSSGPSFATIQNPTSASTTASLVRILRQTPNETPARITYEKASSTSLEESLVRVGLTASWLGGSASAALKAQSASAQSTMLLRFNQAYYTVDWQYDDLPFDRSVSVSRIKASNDRLKLGNPPVYISSVTYGRGLLIAITSNSSVDELEGAMSAAMNSPVFGGKIQIDANSQKIIQKSEIRVLGLGGRASNVTALVSSDKAKALQDYYEQGANFSLAHSPGVPISFRANYFDGSYAKIAFATNYKTRPNCRAQLITALRANISTGSDDKGKEILVGLRVTNGPQAIGGFDIGKDVRYAPNTDNGTFGIAFNPGTSLTTEQCKRIQISLLSQDSNDGWDARVQLLGDLEDGRQNFIIGDSGMQKLGDNGRHEFSFPANGCKF